MTFFSEQVSHFQSNLAHSICLLKTNSILHKFRSLKGPCLVIVCVSHTYLVDRTLLKLLVRHSRWYQFELTHFIMELRNFIRILCSWSYYILPLLWSWEKKRSIPLIHFNGCVSIFKWLDNMTLLHNIENKWKLNTGRLMLFESL